jgi:6-phosphogluconolactonase
MNSEVSRRDFLTLLGAGLVASTAAPQAQSGQKLYAYVGSRTKGGFGVGGGGGLHVLSVDMSNGSLTPVSRTTGPEFENLNVAYIAVSAKGPFLYATNQVENYDGKFGGGAVLTFAVDPQSGTLTHLGTQPSMGDWPAYAVIDKTGAWVAVANHGNYDPSLRVVTKNGVPEVEKIWDDGTVAIYPVRPDGTLGSASDVAVLERTQSVDEYSQRSSHAHSVNFDPSNRVVLVCDKGTDRVYTYRVDRSPGKLTDGKAFQTAPGIAPRHSSFHPRLPYAFVVNERESSLSSYHYDVDTGDLRLVETVPTIPAGTGRNTPADVHVHPNGRFIYSSNRGHNSLAIFGIDEATGRLTLVDIVPTQGATPRTFTFDPSGRYLFSANQGADNIVTFAVDSGSGKLTPTGARVAIPQPCGIQFATL